MRAATRVATFVLGLAVVFAAAYGIGRYAGPEDVDTAGHGDHASGQEADPHAGHQDEEYDVELRAEGFAPGRRELGFTVTHGGEPVTEFDVVHEKRLHLIAVRDDFEGYQHVHPRLADDGTWTVELDLQPGTWQVYADFQPTGGEATTLRRAVTVSGAPSSATFRPETSRTDVVEGYRVTLLGDLGTGASTLTPRVTRGGVDVTDALEPYLGARGHLVALRHDDLSYVHVHPEGLEFHTEVPEPGTYELYLDFKHDGVVRTARFRLQVQDAVSRGTHDH